MIGSPDYSSTCRDNYFPPTEDLGHEDCSICDIARRVEESLPQADPIWIKVKGLNEPVQLFPLHELELPEDTAIVERFSGFDWPQMQTNLSPVEFVDRFEKLVQNMLWASGIKVRVQCSPRTRDKLLEVYYAARTD